VRTRRALRSSSARISGPELCWLTFLRCSDAARIEQRATTAALSQDKGKEILHDDVTIVIPDTPSQSPPPQTIADVTIAGLSRSSLDASISA
jgi:hypothetical protein